MSQDIYIQSMGIGYAILWGIELSVIYDGISVCRVVIRHSNFFMSIQDFLYWIFCAIFVFEHLYEIGNGYMRWYMVLGIGIGMLFYKLTVSKWIVKWISFILQKILWIIGKVFGCMLKPFFYIGRKIKRTYGIYRKKRRSLLRRLKKKLTLKLKMLKIAIGKH